MVESLDTRFCGNDAEKFEAVLHVSIIGSYYRAFCDV
jgi:hypothetical protein